MAFKPQQLPESVERGVWSSETTQDSTRRSSSRLADGTPNGVPSGQKRAASSGRSLSAQGSGKAPHSESRSAGKDAAARRISYTKFTPPGDSDTSDESSSGEEDAEALIAPLQSLMRDMQARDSAFKSQANRDPSWFPDGDQILNNFISRERNSAHLAATARIVQPSRTRVQTADASQRYRSVYEFAEQCKTAEAAVYGNLQAKLKQAERSLREAERQHTSEQNELVGEVMLFLQGEQQAKDELIAQATAALATIDANPASPGAADVESLSQMLSSHNAVWVRCQSDDTVKALTKRTQGLQGVLQQLTALTTRGDVAALQQYLTAQADTVGKLRSRPEVTAAQLLVEQAGQATAEQNRLRQEARAASEAAERERQAAQQRQRQEAAAAAAATAAALAAELETRKQSGYRQLAAKRVEALADADATVKAITESSDADTKRIRLAFRKLFSGSFNKISNDPATLERAVITILDGGAEALRTHSGGEQYYMYSLADQILKRAEADQFNANHFEAAFQLAAVAVDVCAVLPDVRDFMLALMYRANPYLIPSLGLQSTEGMDDAALKAALGMRESDTAEVFVKRMKHLAVMLAAICQAPVQRHTKLKMQVPSELQHPWPLAAAWQWLSRLLNQVQHMVAHKPNDPLPLPLGPVLEGFLKTAAHSLHAAYGRQFTKLLRIIESQVVPRLVPKTTMPHLLDECLDEIKWNVGRPAKPQGRHALEEFRQWGATPS